MASSGGPEGSSVTRFIVSLCLVIKTSTCRPLAGYGLPPPTPGGILYIIFFLKHNVLQAFCNMLAL